MHINDFMAEIPIRDWPPEHRPPVTAAHRSTERHSREDQFHNHEDLLAIFRHTSSVETPQAAKPRNYSLIMSYRGFRPPVQRISTQVTFAPCDQYHETDQR